MPHIVALFRHPVKGFSPEPREALTVLPSGWVEGDRSFAFRFADAPVSDASDGPAPWIPKTNYSVLVNVPGLARVRLEYDDANHRLAITFPDGRTVEAGLDLHGREKLARAVAMYVISQPESPLHGHPERLPLRLIGGDASEHFHDNAAGRVSLHSRGSLRALASALYDPGLDERRFRSNIVIEGAHEWEEFSWVGKRIHIGPPAAIPSPSMGEGQGEGDREGHSYSQRALARPAHPEPVEGRSDSVTPLPPGEGLGEGHSYSQRALARPEHPEPVEGRSAEAAPSFRASRSDSVTPLPPGEGLGEGHNASSTSMGEGQGLGSSSPPPRWGRARERVNVSPEHPEPVEGRRAHIASAEASLASVRGVTFEVVKTSVRCLATHADPVTGERNCDIMGTLTRQFGHDKPQFAISLMPLHGGVIALGDEVMVFP